MEDVNTIRTASVLVDDLFNGGTLAIDEDQMPRRGHYVLKNLSTTVTVRLAAVGDTYDFEIAPGETVSFQCNRGYGIRLGTLGPESPQPRVQVLVTDCALRMESSQ